ncbi:Protein N-acetyltransferase, RimJ/RimL family [Nocardioides scoriae]|uniref:Protein N-acetyltransferase, RimJ/RimL family n=1 Tax=Nocardioides scoriae TaxID=642780 RepID=A0A1H1VB76_9ACTN|nr:GNAT family N-acetyltransferase [Nocardioides scoriae]SDS82028.1 Protein N-acetyltransferase, RimJ/RimL family [Nocardioides scoriae]
MPARPVVRLRAFAPRDDAPLRLLFADPGTRLWNPGTSDDDVTGWRVRSNRRTPDGETWVVADPDDDRLLGTVSLFDVDHGQGTGELGYRVLPAERGRGVAVAGLLAASARAYDVHGLRRLQLFHAVGNGASCGVALAAGFVVEGTLRASYVYGDGVAHDEHLHARLVGDVVDL